MPIKLADIRIDSVTPLNGLRLRILWQNGDRDVVDLSSVLTHPAFDAVRQDHSVFETVRVGDLGAWITWGEDADLSGEQLSQLAKEQASGDFRRWMRHNRLTFDRAARELGLARRTVGKYARGEVRIPRTVKLACTAVEAGLEA